MTTTTKIGRRTHLRTLAGALTMPAAIVPGCGRAQGKKEITVAIWGDVGSVTAYKNVIAKYNAVRPDVDIKFELTPFGQYYQQIDTRLAGRQAPDLFRVEFQVVGRYARSRALMDLTPHLSADYGADFQDAFWQAVTLDGRTFAVPQNTDTLAVFYNADIFEKLGIRIPGSLDQSWSWTEFMDIARLLRARGGVRFPFAMLWQASQAYRWLPFLYQHGGRLLGDDLKTPEIESAKGIETIAWTQDWFRNELVPPNTSIKSNEQPQALFANGTLGMYIG
ncbi:MAG: ABC transporter substrate-binding protein, partial [Nevskiales bacterium]